MKKIFLVLFCLSLCAAACNNKKAPAVEPERTECSETKTCCKKDSTETRCSGDSEKKCCKKDSTERCSGASKKVCPHKQAATVE